MSDLTMPKISLTQEEAQSILDALISNGDSIRDTEKRTDHEKLAIGLVCVKLSSSGMSQRSIGEKLGVPQSTVHRYMKRAWATVALPTVSEARQHALDIIDRMLDVWVPKAEAGDDKAAAIVQKFVAERNKLTGALAPIEINQHVTEETAEERELRMLLDQTERDNKMRAAQVRVDG